MPACQALPKLSVKLGLCIALAVVLMGFKVILMRITLQLSKSLFSFDLW